VRTAPAVYEAGPATQYSQLRQLSKVKPMVKQQAEVNVKGAPREARESASEMQVTYTV
jgi:hypothetical protein